MRVLLVRAGRSRSDRGAAALLVAVFASTLLFPLAAMSVDVARWYLEVERVQSAADAASLAGVTFLPDDFASAKAAALASAAANGYQDGADGGRVHVTVAIGSKPTQLKVTVSSTIRDAWAGFFTDDFTTISRHAVADYIGPAPMGSPCNTFGNEPDGTSMAGPILSQLVVPPGAACTRTPQFWANVHGPNVYKTQGDRYMSRSCMSTEDGCAGSTNTEFTPLGYFLIVRVGAAAVNTPMTLQLYDPAYAATGSRCTTAPIGTVGSNNWNDYATTDAQVRYQLTSGSGVPSAFCAGDDANSGYRVGSEIPTVTSYGLRAPVDTHRPQDGVPVSGCARQYSGYKASSVTASALKRGSTTYDPDLVRVFHQWVPLCTFTPDRAGDYYLQVRTNVALGGVPDGAGGYLGNTMIFTQSGDDTNVKGNGSNRFSVRAISTQAGSISIAGWDRMSVYANADAATTVFNLVRVIPAAASKTLDFSFFDAGDAASNGTIKVLPPLETPTGVGTCTGVGKVTGSLVGCQITGISAAAGWDGKTEHIRVQIPPGYTCNVQQSGGCWFRVQIGFGLGTVTDVTTWTAVVEGDPVRLVE
jgi:hypothetical protein